MGQPVSRQPGSNDPLRDLDARIQAARNQQADRSMDGPARSRDLGAGMRIAIEIAAAIGVGTAIGVLLDRWLNTSPWFLIVFFVIGTAAAFLNVYRISVELDRKRQAERRSQQDAEGDHRGGAA